MFTTSDITKAICRSFDKNEKLRLQALLLVKNGSSPAKVADDFSLLLWMGSQRSPLKIRKSYDYLVSDFQTPFSHRYVLVSRFLDQIALYFL